AERDRGEPHHRADREVDPARDDDRRQRDGEQAELDAEPRHLEEVAEGEKVRRDQREKQRLGGQHQEEHPLAVREPPLPPRRHARARAIAPLTRACAEWRSPSTAMASRMMPPWIARSQYALTPRNVSAGPMAARRTTPSTVPATVP